MLVYYNTKQFLSSSFLKSDFMIGKYLIFIDFSKAHDFTFTRIKDHIIFIEPVFLIIQNLFSNTLGLGRNLCYKYTELLPG